jgi:hypothetical protein
MHDETHNKIVVDGGDSSMTEALQARVADNPWSPPDCRCRTAEQALQCRPELHSPEMTMSTRGPCVVCTTDSLCILSNQWTLQAVSE